MSGNRKKYKKMRARFDESMRLNNQLFLDEQHGVESAKRLAQENE